MADPVTPDASRGELKAEIVKPEDLYETAIASVQRPKSLQRLRAVTAVIRQSMSVGRPPAP